MRYGVDILIEQGFDEGLTADKLSLIAEHLENPDAWSLELQAFLQRVFQEMNHSYEVFMLHLSEYKGEIDSLQLWLGFQGLAAWVTGSDIHELIPLWKP